MFFSFNKNKGRKCLSMQISKKFKRAAFHCQKCVDQKYLSQNFLRTLQIIRFLTIVIWNLEKEKGQKLKNSMFDDPF